MVKLNRRQEEMEALRVLDDKRVNEELYSTYRSIIKDIQAKVADHLEDVGDQPYWKQQQTKALAHLHDEMVDIIREKYPEVRETISKYKEDQLVKGYNGSFYDMEGQTGEELDFPMVNKEFLEASVKAPVAGKRLSERLYRNRERMAKQAQTAVTAGIIQGHSYQKIARQIAGVGETDYRKALRIARTEAGRMHSIGKAKAMSEAKEMGIDVMKQWVSSLDRRTRHTHQFLDGQIVAVDDNFKNASGMEAKMPCMFGQPSEDCNCRCTAVTIVDGIKPTARRDNETGEIIENMTYQEWAKDRLPIEQQPKKQGEPYRYIKNSEITSLKKKAGKITKSERASIYATEKDRTRGYIATPNSFKINRAMRRSETDTLTNYDIKTIKDLDNVLSRNKAPKNIKVNRYDDYNFLETLMLQNDIQAHSFEELAEKLSSGNASYYNKGYTSTSHTPIRNFFTTRPVRTVINVPKGSNMYFSDNDKESEIILPRGAKFDIISAKETHSAILLEMKYIPNKEE